MVQSTIMGDAAAGIDWEKRERDRVESAWHLDRAFGVMIDGWVAGYQSRQCSLLTMCRGIVGAAEAIPPESAPIGGRDRLIGYALRQALTKVPTREGRDGGRPEAFKRMASGLVAAIARVEGLTTTRTKRRVDQSQPSAFDRAAKIINSAGFTGKNRVTPRNVEDWYNEFPEDHAPPTANP
jgi:hypothetical protein